MRRLLVLPVLIALLAAGAADAAAPASPRGTLVLGRSILGVEPGMAFAEAFGRLGVPTRETATDETGRYRVDFARGAVAVGGRYLDEANDRKGAVDFVTTTSTGIRAANGLRPGVRFSLVRSKLRGARCRTENIDLPERPDWYVICSVRGSGGRSTWFYTETGRRRPRAYARMTVQQVCVTRTGSCFIF